ncbi:MAG: hypothetical protein KAY24_00315 [Candidatus Eisenbacteria sp.]|nr:hypothetical protein [Candidatus Eisenbacteria bacterium]
MNETTRIADELRRFGQVHIAGSRAEERAARAYEAETELMIRKAERAEELAKFNRGEVANMTPPSKMARRVKAAFAETGELTTAMEILADAVESGPEPKVRDAIAGVNGVYYRLGRALDLANELLD